MSEEIKNIHEHEHDCDCDCGCHDHDEGCDCGCEDDVVMLQDENGNDLNFEHLMTLEHEGNYYVLLEATEDMDDCKEGEAVILKIIRDEESDEDVYATIEDEDEFNAVFEKCMAAMEEEDAMADALELEPDEEDGDEE